MGSLIEKNEYTAEYYVELYDNETDQLVGTYQAEIYHKDGYYTIEKILKDGEFISCESEDVDYYDIKSGYSIQLKSGNTNYYAYVTGSKIL
jgi:hypothetical protein